MTRQALLVCSLALVFMVSPCITACHSTVFAPELLGSAVDAGGQLAFAPSYVSKPALERMLLHAGAFLHGRLSRC